MELNSPRKDPYSSVSQVERDLEKKGFKETFSVKDEHTIHDADNREYSSDKISIIELHRIVDRENNSQSLMVIGLEAEDGNKGILKTPFGENADETVDRFLQNVDSKSSLNKKY